MEDWLRVVIVLLLHRLEARALWRLPRVRGVVRAAGPVLPLGRHEAQQAAKDDELARRDAVLPGVAVGNLLGLLGVLGEDLVDA